MKFQNPSMHGSEVMLCIKKRNRRTDARMQERPRSNMPLQLVGGHKKSHFYAVLGIFFFGRSFYHINRFCTKSHFFCFLLF